MSESKLSVSMTVNGRSVSGEVDPRTLLVHFIRETLGLTGTHVGCDTSQCGCCTPGMVMSAVDLVRHNADPTEHQVREWLEGNICRCTGYHNIVEAVQAAAARMRAQSS